MPKSYPRAPSNDHIRKTLTFLEATPAQLAEVIGVASGTVSSWVSDKAAAPLWTTLACEALVRRHRKGAKCLATRHQLIVLYLDEERASSVTTVLDAMGVKYLYMEAEG